MKTIMILCVFAATPMYALAIKEPTVLPDAMEGVALEQVTCEAVGGTPPLVWSLKDAPSGIEIIDGGGFGDTDFKVGGVPHMGTGHKDGQVYVVTIVVTDKSPPGGQKAEITLPMTVYAAVRLTSPSDLGVVETGETFSFTLGTAGGYTTTNGGLSFSSPDLPSWLNLNPDTGKLSGIPDTGGTYEFEVTVQDEWSTPTSDTEQYVIQVEFSDVIILTSNLPTATAGEFYSQSLVATGGDGAYQWTVTDLPTGLQADATGVVFGTPEIPGPYKINVAVADGQDPPDTDSALLSLYIQEAEVDAPTITTSYLPPGEEAIHYGPVTLEATGGDGVYTWAITGLPDGLTQTANTMAGTPAAGTSGQYFVTATVTDGAGASSSAMFVLVIEESSALSDEPDSGVPDEFTVGPFLSDVPTTGCSLGTSSRGTALFLLLVSFATLFIGPRKLPSMFIGRNSLMAKRIRHNSRFARFYEPRETPNHPWFGYQAVFQRPDKPIYELNQRW